MIKVTSVETTNYDCSTLDEALDKLKDLAQVWMMEYQADQGDTIWGRLTLSISSEDLEKYFTK